MDDIFTSINDMLTQGDYDATKYVDNFDFNANKAGSDFTDFANSGGGTDFGNIAKLVGAGAKAAGSAFFGGSDGKSGNSSRAVPRDIVTRTSMATKALGDPGKAKGISSEDPQRIYAQWFNRLASFSRKAG